jgi:hypothetical protein
MKPLTRRTLRNIAVLSLLRDALPLSGLLLAALLSGCGGGSTAATSATTGTNSVVYTINKSAPVSTCATGGITVESGIDTNSNGVLDTSEVTSTQYVCNGASGASGTAALVTMIAEPAGTNCTSGGEKVSAGLDTNGNGILDASELTTTAYVCNGANGTNGLNTLVAIVTEPTGASCTYGGIKVTSGLDTNANGTLDSGEVTTTKYVCNGFGINWVDVTGTSVQAVSNTGYMADNAALVTITLPAAPTVGDVIQVSGVGAGGWAIAQAAGQSIIIDSIPGISGANAAVVSGRQYAAIELQYIGSNTFTVLNYTGSVGVLLPGGYVYEGGLTWMPVSATTYTQANAAALCTGSTINGLNDWRLPTESELSAIYSMYPNNSSLLSGLGWTLLNQIWSSTLYSNGFHFTVILSSGRVNGYNDVIPYNVTCVR